MSNTPLNLQVTSLPDTLLNTPLAEPRTIGEALTIAEILVKSGLASFPSALALTGRIIMGKALGLNLVESMTQVYILDGKPAFGATLIAKRIGENACVRYEVESYTEKGCTLTWHTREPGANKEWELRGRSSFDENDARRAGLLGKTNWAKYPRSMYFARALTAGARIWAPGVFGGVPIYVPDELAEHPTHEEVVATILPEDQIPHIVAGDSNAPAPASPTEPTKRRGRPPRSQAEVAKMILTAAGPPSEPVAEPFPEPTAEPFPEPVDVVAVVTAPQPAEHDPFEELTDDDLTQAVASVLDGTIIYDSVTVKSDMYGTDDVKIQVIDKVAFEAMIASSWKRDTPAPSRLSELSPKALQKFLQANDEWLTKSGLRVV